MKLKKFLPYKTTFISNAFAYPFILTEKKNPTTWRDVFSY